MLNKNIDIRPKIVVLYKKNINNIIINIKNLL